MSQDTQPQKDRSPRRAVTVTLAVLLVSWYAFPAGVAGWIGDHCAEGPFCAGLQTIADSVDGASRGVGVAGTLEAARDSVRTALGIGNY